MRLRLENGIFRHVRRACRAKARGRWQVGIAGLTGIVALGVTASASIRIQPSVEPGPGVVARFLAPELMPLVSYRAVRQLTASTRSGKMQAAIEVVTTLDPVKGFRYEIMSEEGSGVIRNKVLLPALETEAKAVHGPGAAGTALTAANYEFQNVVDHDDDLQRIRIHPRRKHAMLIDGTLFLTGDTGDLVRIEGEPSERPSFWTRHVKIVREYARVAGVRVPVSMHSTADVLIVGSSIFSMTYRYTEINGSPVQ